MRSGFPDIVFFIQEQVAEHDKVTSRFEWTGTHNGVFLGIPATGLPVRVWGVVIDRREDGRIKDTLASLERLLAMDTLA
jgi:predicted ester cyclase